MISVFDRVENIVGKGENAGNQHFLLFPQCFQKASFLGVVKSRDCVVKCWDYLVLWQAQKLGKAGWHGLILFGGSFFYKSFAIKILIL